MALTRVSGLSPNVSVAGSVTSDLVSTNLAQIGAATTVHTTGIDLGSGNITSHNIISTGIVTATAFVGDGSQLTGIAGGGGGYRLVLALQYFAFHWLSLALRLMTALF